MNPSSTILIIDDEPLLRMNLRALLEDLGYQVLEAEGGLAGLELCRIARPALVLLDVRMPGMDGFEVCTRIKADPALQAIPVIFLSGLLDTQDKVSAFRSGGVDYVTKPYHLEEVRARVQTHMELHQQRQRLQASNETLSAALRQTVELNRKLLEVNERLCRSEELKGHFLAMMRNEINNPLSAILALGLTLEDGQASGAQATQAGGLIASEASALDFQLKNIFCAAELEAGEAMPSILQLDPTAAVRQVMASFRYLARERAIDLRLEAPEAPDAPFWMDADKFQLIVANLLANAIQHSPAGSPVRIRLALEQAQLRLVVEDSGSGIPFEDQALIFERFWQLKSGTSGNHGQGLGLAVVKALVDLLGGDIAVSSQPGQGSQFSCSLPQWEPSEAGAMLTQDANVCFFGESEEV